jgi:hypothetical protein
VSPSKRPPEATAEGNRLIASSRACRQTRARLDRRRIEVEERTIALDGSQRGSTPGLPETHETRRRAETDLTEPSAPAMDNVPTHVGNDGTSRLSGGRSVDLIGNLKQIGEDEQADHREDHAAGSSGAGAAALSIVSRMDRYDR